MMTRPARGERGAIALMVAAVFGFGVMLGCAALTIDVGSISAERRQLQNGSDAAALSAARDCALTTCPNKDVAADMDRLTTLANGNAADAASGIARVDGHLALCGTGTGLTACDVAANSANLQECPAPKLPSVTTPYVRVYAQTLNKAKTQTLLPYTFGATITGAGSGANQQTCSSAAWGQAGSYTSSVPLTFSYCEWLRSTAGGTYYAPQPSGASPFYGGSGQAAWPNAARTPPLSALPTVHPANGQEVIIYLQGHVPSGYDSGCLTDSSNLHDAPGSFGWVNSLSCNATISSDSWIQTDTGGDTPNACKTVIDPLWKTVIFLPVFDCVTLGPQTGAVPNPLPLSGWCMAGNGNNTYYHIRGWARFYLSGLHLASDDKVSPVMGTAPCNGSDRCISGWFLQGLVNAPIAVNVPGSNFGVEAIQVVG
jgi:Flp pilus assembly protein TadG